MAVGGREGVRGGMAVSSAEGSTLMDVDGDATGKVANTVDGREAVAVGCSKIACVIS